MALAPGARLGPYEILTLVGSGGMGEVYRARDLRLGRDVALKVLPAAFCADKERVRRFEQEMRAVAAVQHPHICALYDVGHQDDIRFFVMEFVAGDTLKAVLSKNGPLPIGQVLGYSIEIADALAHAHRALLVHRDVKPSNIMITGTGAKLIDFGVAKAQPIGAHDASTIANEEDLTAPGSFLGTLRYASPEQLEAGTVDVRSDVFAFGTVVHEMATGRVAFAGASPAAVIAAILASEPVNMMTLQPDTPEALWLVVKKCLARHPMDRWQSAEEIAGQLRIIARARHSEEPVPRRRKAHTGGRRTAAIRSIAVLPLKDFSEEPGQQFFSDGITEALTVALAGFRSLRVISRSSAMRYKDVRKPVIEIARELDVDAVLEGSILRSGDRVRLTVQLIHALTDTHVWAGTFDRDLHDLLTLQDELAAAVAGEISLTVTSTDSSVASRRLKKLDPTAHEAYWRGRYLLERETSVSLSRSFDYLQQAVAIEPRFAPAHVALASWYFAAAIHGLLDSGEAHQHAEEAAEKAIHLDPSLAAAHAHLAEVSFVRWRFDEAERRFRKAVSVGANDAWSIQRFGRFLTLIAKSTEAIDVMRSAERLDPLSVATVAGLGTALYCGRSYGDAIVQFGKALELEHDSPRILCQLGLAFALSGRFADAFKCFDQADANPEVTLYGRSALTAARIHTHARSGDMPKAEALMSEFEAWGHEPHLLAEAHAGLGHVSKALDYLEQAFQQGGLKPLTAKCDPLYDPVRSTEGFQRFLNRLGLPDQITEPQGQ
jgi:serine/threonine protein kinase/tetratricopeptide (TPR) repeat protein